MPTCLVEALAKTEVPLCRTKTGRLRKERNAPRCAMAKNKPEPKHRKAMQGKKLYSPLAGFGGPHLKNSLIVCPFS